MPQCAYAAHVHKEYLSSSGLTGGSMYYCFIQVFPFRVRLFKKFRIPYTDIIFKSFLSLDRIAHVSNLFIINKLTYPILFCKSLDRFILMLPKTFYHIRGHADLKRSILSIRQYITKTLFHSLDSVISIGHGLSGQTGQ